MEPYEKIYVAKAFLETEHGQIDCIDCHGGNPSDPNWQTAHEGLVKDPTDPEIIRFIEEKGYDTVREKLKSSRMNIILKFSISFLVLVASIIIGLAFLVFLLSLQLMISRSSEKIRRFNKLGFHYREISRPYILLLFLLMAGITGLSLLLTSLLAAQLHDTAEAWSLDISPSLHGIIYGTALGLIFLISIANVSAIFISTKKLCK